jgi:6-phosphogluconolactonase
MDEIEWWEFDTHAELATQVVGDIGFVIESAVEAHGGARIALPGKDAPDALMNALAKSKGIAWNKVTILPTDETDPPEISGRLQALFGAKGATIVPLADAHTLQWPLDLVCLGVGVDGRVAGSPQARRWIAHFSPARAPRRRERNRHDPDLGPSLMSARAVMVLVSGAEARATLERAIKDGPLSATPAGGCLQASTQPWTSSGAPNEG